MPIPYYDHIRSGLAAIDEIGRELPHIGKRAELKFKADELLRLSDMIRRNAHLLYVALENEKEKAKKRGGE